MTVRTSLVTAAGILMAVSGRAQAQGASTNASFDTRAEKHRGGVFFTAADLEKRSPARLSDLFRNMSGLTLSTSDGKVVITSSRGARAGMVASTTSGIAGASPTSGSAQTVQPTVTGSRCVVAIGLDGQMMDASFSIDDVAVASVHGVEAYTGSARVPVEFGGGNNSGCGVIMIWSKSGSDKP